MKSPPASNESTAGAGFAPAALPYESRLWRKKVLKVQLKNRHLLHRWRVDLGKFVECANRWSDGVVSKGSNHIPRFEMDDEDPDIIVELNGKYCNKLILCIGLDRALKFSTKRKEKTNLPLAMLKVRGPLRCTLTLVIQTRNTKST